MSKTESAFWNEFWYKIIKSYSLFFSPMLKHFPVTDRHVGFTGLCFTLLCFASSASRKLTNLRSTMVICLCGCQPDLFAGCFCSQRSDWQQKRLTIITLSWLRAEDIWGRPLLAADGLVCSSTTISLLTLCWTLSWSSDRVRKPLSCSIRNRMFPTAREQFGSFRFSCPQNQDSSNCCTNTRRPVKGSSEITRTNAVRRLFWELV